MPEFPGGTPSMVKWLNENIKYPILAEENHITGLVTTEFTINSEGKICDIITRKSVEPLLDKEVLRVVREMPSWIPGKEDGKTMTQRYLLPVYFCLTTKNDSTEFKALNCLKELYGNATVTNDSIVILPFICKSRRFREPQYGYEDYVDPTFTHRAFLQNQEKGKDYSIDAFFKLNDTIEIRPYFYPFYYITMEHKDDYWRECSKKTDGNSVYMWVMQNVKYPSKVLKKGVSGKSTCTFTIERDGTISNITAENKKLTPFDKEVIRLLKMMPKWEPGYHEDHTVKTNYTTTFEFKIK